MTLPIEAIDEFIDVYQKEFGVGIKLERAIELATALLDITSLVIKQVTYEATET